MINMEAEKAAIARQMKAVEGAENRKDLGTMLEAMTEDAILQWCGPHLLQGRDAVRQLYEEFFKVFVSTRLTTLGTEVAASGDMAWVYGIHVNELEGPDGRTKQPGKWICVMRKVDGAWKMAAISISEDS
jgi:uncharacterized protein (TIGR02246 family)